VEGVPLNKPLATAYSMKDETWRRFWEQPGKRFATTFPRTGCDSTSGGVGESRPCQRWARRCGAPIGFADVLRCDDHERPEGGDEQARQDDEASGVRFRTREFIKLKILAIHDKPSMPW